MSVDSPADVRSTMDLGVLALPTDMTLELATTILDAAWEGFAILDHEHRLLSANRTFFELFDLVEEPESGKSLEELGMAGEDISRLRELVPERIRPDEHHEFDLIRDFAGLGRRYLRVQIRGLSAGNGVDPSILLGVHDVSAFMESEAELMELRRDLEERVRRRTAQLDAANHELEAFAYSVSHDLRAPLRALGGFSAALVEDFGESLDEQGRVYVRHIQEAAEQMSQLIDDLLRLSRVTRAEMAYEKFDLSDVARQILETLRGHEKDRRVVASIQDGLVVNGDRALLTAALSNLLENAWKYSRDATDARIEFYATIEDGVRVFAVRDNGAGFDMRYADKLFQPFERLHTTHEFEGNGIGLATVHRILARHGGRIWAEGRPGTGATFYFTLRDSLGSAHAIS